MTYNITTNVPFDFVLARHQADEKLSPKPTWSLRALTASQYLLMKNLLEHDQGRAMLAILQICVVGTVGVTADGSPITCSAGKRVVEGIIVEGGCDVATIDKLPAMDAMELATEALRQNTLTTDDAKN